MAHLIFGCCLMNKGMTKMRKGQGNHIALCDFGMVLHLLIFEGITLRGTILHELAHIAGDRYTAFKNKVYRPGGKMLARNIYEERHGETFQKALRLMLVRAVSIYGEQELEDLIAETLSDLDYYVFFPE